MVSTTVMPPWRVTARLPAASTASHSTSEAPRGNTLPGAGVQVRVISDPDGEASRIVSVGDGSAVQVARSTSWPSGTPSKPSENSTAPSSATE